MLMITRRRALLDFLLSELAASFSPPILDAGGKAINNRGTFNIQDYHPRSDIFFINSDQTVDPDLCIDLAEYKAKSVHNTIIFTEVLEHLFEPIPVLSSLHDACKHDGILVLSSPWLVPIHGDPQDYQRWTLTKLQTTLKASGFSICKVYEMGGLLDVILDLIHYQIHRISRSRLTLKAWSIFARLMNLVFPPIPRRITPGIHPSSITTGWLILARKS